MRGLRSFWLVTCFLLAGTAAWPANTATPFDGHGWREASVARKQLYIEAFLSGVVLGQDRVARHLLLSKDGPDFHPECHPVVVKAINAMETQLERLDPAQLITALDAFYESEANLQLPLRWAIVAVLQQVQDAFPEVRTPPRAP